MSNENKNSRRSFLRKTALGALSLGLIPSLSSAKSADLKKKLSTLVCDRTTLDYYGEGPFYSDNPPVMVDNKLAADNEQGTRVIISGRVRNLDCSMILPNTIIDVWHADDAGTYDNQGFNLRGVTTSNSQGFYMFETILPGKYLNGSKYRPSHVHFKITPPNFPQLITQLYFDGDTDIAKDAAASLTNGEFDASARIIPLTTNEQGVLEGTWDIVIDGNGIVSANDIHIDKGLIYEVTPNPFTDTVRVKYGVFKTSKVSLLVYDMKGRLVDTLMNQELTPEKYVTPWNPAKSLSKGYYFIALKVNDLQVHYLKVLKL